MGAINLSEMLNNERYAFDMLVQAALTGDYHLIDLSKKISTEFKFDNHLIGAIDAYIQNIKEINDQEAFLLQTKSVLTKFANQLYGIKINGSNYRQAVERMLLKVNNNERTFSINLARKFYPYCGGLNRTISKDRNDMSKSAEQKNALRKSWDNLDEEFFYDKEITTLGHYVDFMRENRYPEKDITISEKIAKIITLEIRKKQINPNNAYRDAVDVTQSLFDNDELKGLTMIVSREYHDFWVGNIPKLWGYM